MQGPGRAGRASEIGPSQFTQIGDNPSENAWNLPFSLRQDSNWHPIWHPLDAKTAYHFPIASGGHRL